MLCYLIGARRRAVLTDGRNGEQLADNRADHPDFTVCNNIIRCVYRAELINNESITQKTCFRPMYGLFVLEAYICTASLRISLHGNVNNSKLGLVYTADCTSVETFMEGIYCFGVETKAT